MRIKHHYYIKSRMSLMKFLDKHQIPYKTDNLPGIKGSMYTFDLYEDQEVYKKFILEFPFVARRDLIESIEYSKKEIENAEWLTVRSISTKVDWEYDEDAFRQSCFYKRPCIKELYYKHSEQVGVLSVNKPVKWGTRQFFSGPNAADNIIFCSEKTKLVLDNKWKGLEFWPVKKYNNSIYISDLYQLYFMESLPIDAIKGGSLITCNTCGRRIIWLTKGVHQMEINRKYLTSPDRVYKTGDVLTEQPNKCTTFSLNIVSQKFYQYCEKNQMNRGMIYEPIKLI